MGLKTTVHEIWRDYLLTQLTGNMQKAIIAHDMCTIKTETEHSSFRS